MLIYELSVVKRIEDNHSLKLSAVKPRGVILIGTSDHWNRSKREGLRKPNHALHSIEVITYTDLLRRGQSLLALYENAGL